LEFGEGAGAYRNPNYAGGIGAVLASEAPWAVKLEKHPLLFGTGHNPKYLAQIVPCSAIWLLTRGSAKRGCAQFFEQEMLTI
jgi:hypothetical protein